jgi:hypothetical protein
MFYYVFLADCSCGIKKDIKSLLFILTKKNLCKFTGILKKRKNRLLCKLEAENYANDLFVFKKKKIVARLALGCSSQP